MAYCIVVLRRWFSPSSRANLEAKPDRVEPVPRFSLYGFSWPCEYCHLLGCLPTLYRNKLSRSPCVTNAGGICFGPWPRL